MILKNKGLYTDHYFVPPFSLRAGDLVVLQLVNGMHYQPTSVRLTSLFTGQVTHESVYLYAPVRAVETIVEPGWRRFFFPLTVGGYLRRSANRANSYAVPIDKVNPWLTSQTKLNRLAATPRKQLSLLASLSHAQHLVVDLAGLDPAGITDMCSLIKAATYQGGAAIVLDWTDELRADCTQFIALQ